MSGTRISYQMIADRLGVPIRQVWEAETMLRQEGMMSSLTTGRLSMSDVQLIAGRVMSILEDEAVELNNRGDALRKKERLIADRMQKWMEAAADEG